MDNTFVALEMCRTCKYGISSKDSIKVIVACEKCGPKCDKGSDCLMHDVSHETITKACSSITRAICI